MVRSPISQKSPNKHKKGPFISYMTKILKIRSIDSAYLLCFGNSDIEESPYLM